MLHGITFCPSRYFEELTYLVVTEPVQSELVKQICIKEFHKFHSHKVCHHKKIFPYQNTSRDILGFAYLFFPKILALF